MIGEDEEIMKRTDTAICAALIALMVAGLAAQPASADGDKKKDKGPVVIIKKPIVTQDPPKK